MSAWITRIAVRKQLTAMSCSLFDIGVLRSNAHMILRDGWSGTTAEDLTIVLLVTLVKKERGSIRLIGTVLNPLSPGFTFAYGVSRMR